LEKTGAVFNQEITPFEMTAAGFDFDGSRP